MFKLVKIKSFENGLKFKNGKLIGLLTPGWHLIKTLMGESIEILREKDLFVVTSELDQLIVSGLLADKTELIDLKDDQRALIWVDDRFYCLLSSGKTMIWKTIKKIRIEVVTVNQVKFEHRQLFKIANSPSAGTVIESVQVDQGELCLFFCDGHFIESLSSGFYAFWKDFATLRFIKVSLKEKILDLSGQEIISADKVSLRLNAVVSYKVIDAWKFATISDATEAMLYREAQLAMRTAIGSKKIDDLLAEKDQTASEILTLLQKKGNEAGVEILGFGIRDVILPGEMREIMNRVVSAQKEAEANQIMRREETAATRSQFNTAKMIENNPTLMRLRELELIEKIAEKSDLKLIIGEKGLTGSLVNLL
ncbi:MAG: slipin family protein [Candidatus Rifleibacteriota bacterium]